MPHIRFSWAVIIRDRRIFFEIAENFYFPTYKTFSATMREAIRSKYKIENGENDKRNRFKKQFKTCIWGPIYFSVSLNIYN